MGGAGGWFLLFYVERVEVGIEGDSGEEVFFSNGGAFCSSNPRGEFLT